MTDLVVREYGAGPVTIIAVHGGPAAAGDLKPLARKLGEKWRVFEPFQRGSGGPPLTVATHVRDLHELFRERGEGRPAFLVGHSWGAMLSLAYAAAHPATVAGLALVGCGTFSREARAEFRSRHAARLTPELRAGLARVEEEEQDADRRFATAGRLLTRAYGFDVGAEPSAGVVVDAVAHEQTWADMVRLQEQGVYPAAFASVRCPVLMLHGEADPHPGARTRDDLRRSIPHLEYVELPRCGHSPWLERQAREGFFAALDAWIGRLPAA